MMTVAQGAHAPARSRAAPSAVVWINDRKALVAETSLGGSLSTCEFERGPLPEPEYLAQVVRLIGDRDRVVILGPGSDRLALEREYVSIYQRPDRLLDVEPSHELRMEELVERLRTLSA